MSPAVKAVLEGKMRATARNSAPRIHWGALVAGYYAVMQKEVGGKDIPEFILADGPVILPPTKEKTDKPWLLKGYSIGAGPGLLWEEKHFLA
jgi:ribose transport system substrate-binding protein